jgi:peptide/nickel transport system substrate-binding protein
MDKRHLVASAIAASALTLAGCASSGSPVASGGSPAAGGAGTTFVYDTYTNVMSDWDPASAYATEINALNNMYETLTRYDSTTSKVVPDLATKWSSSADGKTWTFTLRQGVHFHTGRIMNAAAVKASIERTLKINQGAAYIWQPISSIDTPSPYTVVMHLKFAAPMDLRASADYSAFIYDTKAAGSGNLTSWFQKGRDAGTGPYTVQSWHPGQENELTLKEFPGYWGGWQGSHYKEVIFQVVRQDSTASQLVQSGQVSFVEQLSPQLWSSLKSNPNLKTTSQTSWENLLLCLNTRSGPLANIRVRKAVAAGINYNGIIDALQGAAVRQPGLVPAGLFGHSNSVPQYQYNPSSAKAQLAALGYGPGKKALSLTLTYTQGDSNEQTVSTLIKSSLAALNVNVKVDALQTPTKYAKARSSNLAQRQDMTFFYWYPDYADPYSWFINLIHTQNPPVFNLSYFSNKKLDQQIDSIEQLTAVNRARAAALYTTMQDEVYGDVPLIAMYTVITQRVLQKSVQGFVENPAYPEVVFFYQLRSK